MDRLTELENIFNNFNMIGQDGITVHGDLHRGYAVGILTTEGATGFLPSFPTPPTPTPTGACCDGTDCSITTETGCTGDYQGDNTDCDPNPCGMPPCCSDFFTAFDGSGRKFLTRTVGFIDTANTCDCYITSDNCSGSYVENYNPDTCEFSFVSNGCDGTVTCCFPEIPDLCGFPGSSQSCSDNGFFGCPSHPVSGFDFSCSEGTITHTDIYWQCFLDLSNPDCSPQTQIVWIQLSDECS